MKDIEDLQWSATSEKTFRELFDKLKEKYSGSGSEIDDFLQYHTIIIETPVESPVLPRRTRRKQGLVSDYVRTPPAKKITLSYMESEQLIVSIEKPKTRGRRNKK